MVCRSVFTIYLWQGGWLWKIETHSIVMLLCKRKVVATQKIMKRMSVYIVLRCVLRMLQKMRTMWLSLYKSTRETTEFFKDEASILPYETTLTWSKTCSLRCQPLSLTKFTPHLTSSTYYLRRKNHCSFLFFLFRESLLSNIVNVINVIVSA